MPKVSIIIPLHNSEAFIAETIQSCLDQSYPDIEVIVVENGSTDHSYDTVKAMKDERIRLFKIETPNASAARNFGLQQADGDYIQFLDADDLMSPNKIAQQIKALAAKPDGWLASCAWAKFRNHTGEAIIQPQKVWRIEAPMNWCVSAMSGGGMMIPGCWLIPRSVLDRAGIWNENLSLHDDGEFMCRVLLVSKGNCFTEEALVYYRQVENSLSAQNTSRKAAQSSLAVCHSYKQELLARQDDESTRHALAFCYRRFIYEFHPQHQPLIEEAQKELKKLNVHLLPLVGGNFFKKLAAFIGFDNALKLRALVKRIKVTFS